MNEGQMIGLGANPAAKPKKQRHYALSNYGRGDKELAVSMGVATPDPAPKKKLMDKIKSVFLQEE